MTPLASNYLDGNAAAGELSKVFALDLTAAEGQCAHCGARKRFADAHVYMQSPGVVARCPVCQHVLLRLVSVRRRVFLDLRGMTYLTLDTAHVRPSELTHSGS
jgi:NAD-dependent SIR2 family protein deacetylase